MRFAPTVGGDLDDVVLALEAPDPEESVALEVVGPGAPLPGWWARACGGPTDGSARSGCGCAGPAVWAAVTRCAGSSPITTRYWATRRAAIGRPCARRFYCLGPGPGFWPGAPLLPGPPGLGPGPPELARVTVKALKEAAVEEAVPMLEGETVTCGWP